MSNLLFTKDDCYDLPTIAILNSVQQNMSDETIDSISQQITIRYNYYPKNYVTNNDLLQFLDELCEEWILFKDNQQMDLTTILEAQKFISKNIKMEVCFFNSFIYNEDGEKIIYSFNQPQDISHGLELTPDNLLIKKAVLKEIIKNFKYDKVFLYNDLLCEISNLNLNTQYNHDILYTKLSDKIDINFNNDNKVLALAHELSVTGAPVVLLETLKLLKKNGYDVVVYAPRGGDLVNDCISENISVVIDERLYFYTADDFKPFKDENFTVLAITLCLAYCIPSLMENDLNVMWWIHDAEPGYEFFKTILPEKLNKNVHLYSGGEHAGNIMLKYAPQYHIENFLYGVKYRDGSNAGFFDTSFTGGKKLFSCIGTLENRKGQDLLCEAIENLPIDILNQCFFFFVGNDLDKSIYDKVKLLEQKHPENVKYLKLIPRTSIDSLYKQTDCIICVSRDDPMPVFVTEGFLFKKPAICSENTGTASLIKQNSEGFVYKNDSVDEIEKCITKFINLSDKERDIMGENANKLFFKYFSMDNFEKNLLKIFKKVSKNG